MNVTTIGSLCGFAVVYAGYEYYPPHFHVLFIWTTAQHTGYDFLLIFVTKFFLNWQRYLYADLFPANVYVCTTVEPVYYGHLGTNEKYPDYQGVLIIQVSLYDKAPFGTITRYVDYAGVLIFKCLD